ncbi:diguanylate cyclase domain-containing protein [Mycobacterium sp.]|uniref:diguanylate cyclase domain-containing protein n=1 Tax=Mycobacterium sp. TaxID=1785 RepID=UPI003C781D20
MGLSEADVLLDAVTDRGIVKLDSTGKVVHWSAGAQALFGYSDAEVLGRHVSMFHTDDDRAGGTAERELAAAQEFDRFEVEGWQVRKGGHHFRAGVVLSAVRDQAGSLTGFVKVMRDVAVDQQRAHPIFRDLLEAAPDAMVIVGPDGRITLANAQTDRMFGYSREDLVGSELEMLLPPRLRGKHIRHRTDFFAGPMLRPMGGGLELWGLRRDGTEFPVDISLSPLRIEQSLCVSAAIRDVTERREHEQRLRLQHEELIETQRELERLALIDTRTGLVNHAETIARLEAALGHPRLHGSYLGVLFCDTDQFKAINDTWGHTVGDIVLSTVAGRICDCVRDGDTVGRVGGDEMLVLLPGVHSIDEVVLIAEKIRCRAAEPIHHLGRTIYTTLSIGATLAARGESVSAVTTRADAAMYKAKRAGRDTVTSI